ncbi:MAG: hypothetical protein ACE149_19625 [Armatimonadota bacterium]
MGKTDSEVLSVVLSRIADLEVRVTSQVMLNRLTQQWDVARELEAVRKQVASISDFAADSRSR